MTNAVVKAIGKQRVTMVQFRWHQVKGEGRRGERWKRER